jgi:hypothetical protein
MVTVSFFGTGPTDGNMFNVRGCVSCDTEAGPAFQTRVYAVSTLIGRVFAEQGLGESSREGGFTDPFWADKEISMAKPVIEKSTSDGCYRMVEPMKGPGSGACC